MPTLRFPPGSIGSAALPSSQLQEFPPKNLAAKIHPIYSYRLYTRCRKALMLLVVNCFLLSPFPVWVIRLLPH
jgi:hypothetical protein